VRRRCRVPSIPTTLPVEVELPSSAAVQLVLRSTASFSGRVVDGAGAPVSGAWVELFSQPAFGHDQMVVSEADGTFAFEASPRPYFLRASADGYAPSEWLVATPELARELVLTLRRPGTIEGEVAGTDGHPLAAHYVSLRGAHEGDMLGTSSESDGRFRFTDLPADEYELSAQLDGSLVSARVTVEAGQTARVRLAPPVGTVRLRGLVNLGGAPGSGALVSCGEATGSCDERGEFMLVLPGPGEYTLQVSFEWPELDESLSVGIPIEVPRLAEYACELSIPLARLRGRVSATGGVPVQLVVGASGDGADAPELLSSTTYCDADGRYELRVVPGRITVSAGGPPATPWAEAARTVVVASGQELDGVDLELSPGGRIRGRVRLENGLAAPGVTVWGLHDGRRTSGVADEHGFFDISGLAHGEWQVTATGSGAATRAPMAVTLSASEVQRIELTLVPAATVEVRLEELQSGVRRWLTLLDDSGQVLEGPLDPGPRARFGPLTFGRYRLRVELAGESREHPFEVASTSTVVLTPDAR
ncbi:MAG: carboxypeptidase-like regulatory domain-containing protein, partial [Planctomycetota bacterium]